MSKLSVAVIWHMHQPLYKDRLTGRYLMPWVRLHAIKDYLDMVEILRQYPKIRQTFNLVPSLLEQLVDYGHHGAIDRALELTLKPIDRMAPDDKAYLLERFFDLNWENQLRPYPRYLELANQRNELMAHMSAVEAAARFSDQDLLDLTVWFNLAWFDPMWLSRDAELHALLGKGRGFTQGDRELLIAKQRELIRAIIPTYTQMQAEGRIELTTTPFYHPILPLLVDTQSARVARPELPLPSQRYQHPEDARAQVRKGLDYFEENFGYRPSGMWPSEESVSPAVVELVADQGVSWIVSDEGVLAHSLGAKLVRDGEGRLQDPATLYQPYWAESNGKRVAMVFRDIVLSDLIGFSYSRMSPQDAARDLHGRLKAIHSRLPQDDAHLVTIALDGENCWEYYTRDGADFLQAFYELVSNDAELSMVTVGEYLRDHEPRRTLHQLHSGSWIYSDFTTWIGDPTKNRAWDYLYQARQVLADHPEHPRFAEAQEEIYIAEGSDWFWWFGEGHNSGQDDLFDWQFRLHLQNVYQLLGQPVPEELLEPVAHAEAPAPAVKEFALTPSVDGRLASAETWKDAGIFDPTLGQGAMHAATQGIRRIRYGTDAANMYLRVEFADSFLPGPGDTLALYLCYPGQTRFNAPINFDCKLADCPIQDWLFAHEVRVTWDPMDAVLSQAGEYNTWHALKTYVRIAYQDALDISLPLKSLRQEAGAEIRLAIALGSNGVITELVPRSVAIPLNVSAKVPVAGH
jgi:alpha-amylase/alpha-mannosidase (GH57 family)